MPSLIIQAGYIVSDFAYTITAAFPQILKAGYDLLGSLLKGVISNLPQIASSVAVVMADFLSGIALNMPDIISAGMDILGNMLAGLIKAIPKIPGKVKEIFNEFKQAFSAFDWAQIGTDILDSIISGIKNFAGKIKDAVSSVWSEAKGQSDTAQASVKASAIPEMSARELAADGIGSTDAIREAVIEGMESANLSVTLNGRELSRGLKGLGVAFG